MWKKTAWFFVLLIGMMLTTNISYSEVSTTVGSLWEPLSSSCALIFPSRRDTRISIFLFLWLGPLAIIIWKWIRHKTQRWY